MSKSIAVFDFDKTLTNKDTLFGFYKTVAADDPLFSFKRMILIAAGILYKSCAIKNRTLKRVGIFLFLKGRTRDELETAALEYCKQIELNEIYSDHYQTTDADKWIVSASPEVYLRYLFPGGQVAGTTFTYHGGKVTGLEVNMFGTEKRHFLVQRGITRIHKLYTDSMTDKSLMDIAEKVYVVNRGQIVQSK